MFECIFINDMDDGVGCTLNKSADNTKLGGVADKPDSCTAIQRNLDRLEKQSDKNHYVLGSTQLESSLAEKDLGVMVDTRWNLSQQYTFVSKKTNGIQGCIRSRMASRPWGVIFPIYSALMRTTVSSSGVLSTGEIWKSWTESSEGRSSDDSGTGAPNM